MKREIKFKRYHFDFNGKCCYVSEWGFIDNTFVSPASISTEDRERVVDCQYTGLKDKNGKEIYEGDVLKFPFDMGIGFVVNDGFRFAIESPGSHAVDYESREVLESAEITGNLYQNEEIIK